MEHNAGAHNIFRRALSQFVLRLCNRSQRLLRRVVSSLSGSSLARRTPETNFNHGIHISRKRGLEPGFPHSLRRSM